MTYQAQHYMTPLKFHSARVNLMASRYKMNVYADTMEDQLLESCDRPSLFSLQTLQNNRELQDHKHTMQSH